MKTHDLAKELLKGEDVEIEASIDISTCDGDSDKRIFTDQFFGINYQPGDTSIVTLLFGATVEKENNTGIFLNDEKIEGLLDDLGLINQCVDGRVLTHIQEFEFMLSELNSKDNNKDKKDS